MAKKIGMAAVAICIVILGLNAAKLAGALEYQDNMLAAGSKVAGALFVSAVLLERSLAVLNSLLFGEEATKARAVVLFDGSAAAFEALDEVKTKETAIRLAVGFIVAMCVSAAGIRTLQALVKSAPGGTDTAAFFFAIDVIVTAGLLAGGSNALAAIIEIFKTRAQLAYVQTIRRLRA